MAMCRRPKRFIVTVKILDIIRPWDFHRGDLLLGLISSAEGVNGYDWLKLVERYCTLLSLTHTYILRLLEMPHHQHVEGWPGCQGVAHEASWAGVVGTGHFQCEEGDSYGHVPAKCLAI